MNNGKMSSMFYGLFIGGLVGSAIALLYAPMKGTKMRKVLNHKKEEVLEDVVNYFEDSVDKVDKIYKHSMKRADKIMNTGIKRAENIISTAKKMMPV